MHQIDARRSLPWPLAAKLVAVFLLFRERYEPHEPINSRFQDLAPISFSVTAIDTSTREIDDDVRAFEFLRPTAKIFYIPLDGST